MTIKRPPPKERSQVQQGRFDRLQNRRRKGRTYNKQRYNKLGKMSPYSPGTPGQGWSNQPHSQDQMNMPPQGNGQRQTLPYYTDFTRFPGGEPAWNTGDPQGGNWGAAEGEYHPDQQYGPGGYHPDRKFGPPNFDTRIGSEWWHQMAGQKGRRKKKNMGPYLPQQKPPFGVGRGDGWLNPTQPGPDDEQQMIWPQQPPAPGLGNMLPSRPPYSSTPWAQQPNPAFPLPPGMMWR